jgi:glutathione S-transferase
MKLYLSARSPFARRVRLALLRLGVPFELSELNVFQPPAEFFSDAPLGLVPVLKFDDGQVLSDSDTLLEYLHENYGQKIWSADLKTRFHERLIATYAAGLMTSSVAYFLESQHAKPEADWMDEHYAAIQRTLKRLEAEHLPPSGTLTQPHWDIGVGLEYLDLRLSKVGWRETCPGLVKTLDSCRKDPDFVKTTPPPV